MLRSCGGADISEVVSVVVELTGHFSTSKVMVGGGGCGTCCADLVDDSVDVH